MTALKWDETGKKLYETGVDRGVLYVIDTKTGKFKDGVAWNGLTKVSESPEGGEANAKYANNGTYLNMISQEIFKGEISAFMYPDEFAACDGSASPQIGGKAANGVRVTGQTRAKFGFTYRTLIGNDLSGDAYGYNIHLVYNATAAVSSKDYETVNDSPEAIEFSWEFSTDPVDIPGMKKSSHIIIDSTKLEPATLQKLEQKLYGTGESQPTLPSPEELFTLLGQVGG